MKLLGFALALIVYSWAVLELKKRRLWLPYYALAVFGLTFFLILLFLNFRFDRFLGSWEMNQVCFLARLLNLPLQVISYDSLAIKSAEGWVLLSIGLECSALIELSVFAGLILFYPAFSPSRKAIFLLAGLAGTYLINLLRILLIVALIATYGQGIVFVAHAIIGRLFFFAAVVILCWYFITSPTLAFLKEKVEER